MSWRQVFLKLQLPALFLLILNFVYKSTRLKKNPIFLSRVMEISIHSFYSAYLRIFVNNLDSSICSSENRLFQNHDIRSGYGYSIDGIFLNHIKKIFLIFLILADILKEKVLRAVFDSSYTISHIGLKKESVLQKAEHSLGKPIDSPSVV